MASVSEQSGQVATNGDDVRCTNIINEEALELESHLYTVKFEGDINTFSSTDQVYFNRVSISNLWSIYMYVIGGGM